MRPSVSIYQHLYFRGFFKVKAAEGSYFELYHHGMIEENEIFWNGLYKGWEKKTMSIWSELVQRADVIFDIGANTGLYALVARTLQPKAEIHCFEPVKGTFRLLQKNMERNQFDCHLHEIALSDQTGEATIYLKKGTDFAYSVTVNKNTLDSADVDAVTIRTQTIADFIEEQQLEHISLMKIDVETHEVEVLKGMGDYLNRFRPVMIIEVLNESIASELTLLLKDKDYLYFNIDDMRNTIRQTAVIEKSDFWNYLVCDKLTAQSLGLI